VVLDGRYRDLVDGKGHRRWWFDWAVGLLDIRPVLVGIGWKIKP